MALRDYVRKRKFSRTPEPAGKPATNKKKDTHLFVIQKHAARRLHYDLRFEADGVLKSWAVPKGLPLRKAEKHLAIHVEDHPRDYATFEGTIPAGNYGAGSVIVWDIGTYEVADGDFAGALRRGRIHFTLHGKKLHGDWSLVRLKKNTEKDEWLVIKHGPDAKAISRTAENSSALSRRNMEQPAKLQTNAPPGRTEAPRFINPMKALLVKTLPADNDWIQEIKFDGMRVIAVKNGRSMKLFSRTRHDVTAQFRSIADALKKLPCTQGTLDGEIVALDEAGRSSFQMLQPYFQARSTESTAPLFYYLFDLLNYEGKNIASLPIEARKELLQSILPKENNPLRFSDDLAGPLKALLREARRQGLEGLICKRRGTVYEPDRRSGAWIKLKTVQEQEFVIGAYTPPKGSRQSFGALLVGYYDKGKLRFASKVGTGFDEALLKSLHARFAKIRRTDSPFVDLPGTLGGNELKHCTWLQPKLVCQVRFSEWTHGGGLRQPVFLGLREDKPARQVRREKAVRK